MKDGRPARSHFPLYIAIILLLVNLVFLGLQAARLCQVFRQFKSLEEYRLWLGQIPVWIRWGGPGLILLAIGGYLWNRGRAQDPPALSETERRQFTALAQGIRPPLGGLYRLLFNYTVAGLWAIGIIGDGTPFGSDKHISRSHWLISSTCLAGFFWLLAVSKWGRDRQLEALDWDEDRREQAFDRIRQLCWGSAGLLLTGVAAYVVRAMSR